jgi:hypothetical protein
VTAADRRPDIDPGSLAGETVSIGDTSLPRRRRPRHGDAQECRPAMEASDSVEGSDLSERPSSTGPGRTRVEGAIEGSPEALYASLARRRVVAWSGLSQRRFGTATGRLAVPVLLPAPRAKSNSGGWRWRRSPSDSETVMGASLPRRHQDRSGRRAAGDVVPRPGNGMAGMLAGQGGDCHT